MSLQLISIQDYRKKRINNLNHKCQAITQILLEGGNGDDLEQKLSQMQQEFMRESNKLYLISLINQEDSANG